MSNKQQILIGSDNFKKMITNSDVFVDKSIFIKEIIDSKEDAILITKPRRWGKTSNLDMLKTFFAIEVDDKGVININSTNKILFTGGYINDGAKQLTQLNIARVGFYTGIPDFFDLTTFTL